MLDRMAMFGMDGGPTLSDLPTQDQLEALSPEEVWVRLKGETPLEFLVRLYRNPWMPMRERRAAAESVMAFMEKQRAAAKEQSAMSINGILTVAGLGRVDIGKLSDDELNALDTLLSKARDGAVTPTVVRSAAPERDGDDEPRAKPRASTKRKVRK
jgi:hypothetical protein